MGKPKWHVMREFMDIFLEQKGNLVHVKDEVDPKVAGGLSVISLYSGSPAVEFDNIKGADAPCIVGTIATQQRLLWAWGIDSIEQFNDEYAVELKNLSHLRLSKLLRARNASSENSGR